MAPLDFARDRPRPCTRLSTSAPAAAACWSAGSPKGVTVEEAHRFTYPPRESAGHLRWDFDRLLDGIYDGAAAGRGDRHPRGPATLLHRGRLVGRRLRAHRRVRRPDRGSDLLSRSADGGHAGACLRPDGTRSHLSRNGHSVSPVQHHLPAHGARRGRSAVGGGAAPDDSRSLPQRHCAVPRPAKRRMHRRRGC